uniref:Reverse transcriptase domain-containing protein n=1 Tax=Trichuris muris TaxID=70415 RepID=A0A5S6QYP8_TRIMR
MFMERFEDIAFPDGFSAFGAKMFKRYVDDIFVIIEDGKEVALLEHLNALFPGKVIFTMEREEKGKLVFVDSLVIRDQGHIKTKVFRKPTNSERLLNLRNLDLNKRQARETPTKTICIPYYPGLGEGIRKIARSIGYTVASKSLPNLMSILRSDKIRIQYFGETGHTLPHRQNEHKMAVTRYKNAEKRLRGEIVESRVTQQVKDPDDVMKEAVNASA